MRNFQGADCYSDHQFVVANFKLKTGNFQLKPFSARTFNGRKLRDLNVRQEYVATLSNKFSVEGDSDDYVEF